MGKKTARRERLAEKVAPFPVSNRSAIRRCHMFCEVTIPEHERRWIVRQRCGIWRPGDIRPDCGIFRLRVGDAHGITDANETEELGPQVLVHPNAAVRAWAILQPADVKSVTVANEATPVRHRGALERPACRFFIQIRLPGFAPVGRITMRVCTVFVVLFADAIGTGRSRGARSSHRHRHYQQGLIPLHYVGQLLGKRDFHSDIRGIGRQLGWSVVIKVSTAPGRAGLRRSGTRHSNRQAEQRGTDASNAPTGTCRNSVGI